MIDSVAAYERPSLYVHVPFCVSKCRYCDFNSHEGAGRDLDGYVDALVEEARRRAPRRPPTVFIGGGTPTFLPETALARLMSGLADAGAFDDPGVEVTVEANPESASLEKLRRLRAGGATRLSIGVQSFRERYLHLFDRVHGVDDARRAIEHAREAGFRRVNLDLIAAKPGESAGEWSEDLERALALAPEHLSCYELTFEEGTALRRDLARGRVEPVDEDARAALDHATAARLARDGFLRYEVSAFARDGEECRHNLVYWTSGEWIGIGAGAGTSIGARKHLNVRSPEAYAAAIRTRGDATDPATVESSDADTRLAEVLLMGLRLADGLPLDVIRRRSGTDLLARHAGVVRALEADGLVRCAGGRIRCTDRGRDLGDHVVQ
ncbi:MAG TPA: radical SAM family heme chaperone HemW, partial [Planctomycetota bacterium]|nr:radical SAM family heme chaperone HemW [Planctomycetota bacterium]